MKLKPSLGISMHVTGVPRYFTSDYVQGVAHLRTISGIVHEHHPCGGNREICLGPVFRPFSNSHQYKFQIRLFQMDIYTFSGQKKVTKCVLNIY